MELIPHMRHKVVEVDIVGVMLVLVSFLAANEYAVVLFGTVSV